MPAQQGCDGVGVELAEEGYLADGGKQDGSEDICRGEEEGEEAGERGGFGGEHLARLDGERREDEEVEAVGEEHLPLEDGDGSHDDEGEEDEEVLILDGAPEGALMWRRGVRVLQEEREHEAGDGDGGEGADDGGGGVAFDLDGVVVEEAAEEMVDKEAGDGGLRHGAPS